MERFFEGQTISSGEILASFLKGYEEMSDLQIKVLEYFQGEEMEKIDPFLLESLKTKSPFAFLVTLKFCINNRISFENFIPLFVKHMDRLKLVINEESVLLGDKCFMLFQMLEANPSLSQFLIRGLIQQQGTYMSIKNMIMRALILNGALMG